MTRSDGTNSLGKKAMHFIERIEEIDAEIDALTAEHMAKCKAQRERRKEVYVDAKNKGLATKPLKAIVKTRKLERKIDATVADLDLDETAIYREISETLGPLGQAAAIRAGYGHVESNDDADIRPEFMQRAEAEKAAAHEAGLKTVGRGRPKLVEPTDPVDAALS